MGGGLGPATHHSHAHRWRRPPWTGCRARCTRAAALPCRWCACWCAAGAARTCTGWWCASGASARRPQAGEACPRTPRCCCRCCCGGRGHACLGPGPPPPLPPHAGPGVTGPHGAFTQARGHGQGERARGRTQHTWLQPVRWAQGLRLPPSTNPEGRQVAKEDTRGALTGPSSSSHMDRASAGPRGPPFPQEMRGGHAKASQDPVEDCVLSPDTLWAAL